MIDDNFYILTYLACLEATLLRSIAIKKPRLDGQNTSVSDRSMNLPCSTKHRLLTQETSLSTGYWDTRVIDYCPFSIPYFDVFPISLIPFRLKSIVFLWRQHQCIYAMQQPTCFHVHTLCSFTCSDLEHLYFQCMFTRAVDDIRNW